MNSSRILQVLLLATMFLLVSCGPGQSETVSFDPVTPESATEPQESPTSTSEPTAEPSATAPATATEEPTPEPTQTPEPTNTPVPTPTAEPTEPPSLLQRLGLVQGEPDLNVLAERLLNIENAPIGWSVEATEIEEKDGEGSYDPFCKTGLPARSIGSVSVDFNGGGLMGPMIFESITAYRSVEDATQSFAEYKGAANDCPQWTSEDGTEYTLSALAFPAYGDESFAFRMQFGLFTFDRISIRMGDVLLGVTNMGTETDAELLQTFVEDALAKLD